MKFYKYNIELKLRTDRKNKKIQKDKKLVFQNNRQKIQA